MPSTLACRITLTCKLSIKRTDQSRGGRQSVSRLNRFFRFADVAGSPANFEAARRAFRVSAQRCKCHAYLPDTNRVLSFFRLEQLAIEVYAVFCTFFLKTPAQIVNKTFIFGNLAQPKRISNHTFSFNTRLFPLNTNVKRSSTLANEVHLIEKRLIFFAGGGSPRSHTFSKNPDAARWIGGVFFRAVEGNFRGYENRLDKFPRPTSPSIPTFLRTIFHKKWLARCETINRSR